MITALAIRNFQSIERLDVGCGPITVFYGESDTGKSAIVRALYALAFNSYPAGHVREGWKDSKPPAAAVAASEISVTVEVPTRHGSANVTAFKGPDHNNYTLMPNADSEVSSWGKVGTDVPVEVTNALGWSMLWLDDGSKFAPNFQLQFDPPFLLTESPSKAAKVLGSLTNVATLYAAVKEANAWERRAKSRVESHQEIVERSAVEAEALAEPLELSRKLLEELSRSLADAKTTHVKAEHLNGMMLRVIELQETHQLAKDIVAMMDASLPEGLDRVEALLPKMQGLDALYQNVKLYENRIRSTEIEVATYDQELEAAAAAVELFAEVHGVCPLCGQSLGDDHID